MCLRVEYPHVLTFHSGNNPERPPCPLQPSSFPSSPPATCRSCAGFSSSYICRWDVSWIASSSSGPRLQRALVTVVAEVAGRLVLSQGLAGSFRPRKYFTIPREALEATLEDLQQLLDFFLIEFQRVLFAENIIHTVAVWFDIRYKLGSSPTNTDLSIGFLWRLHCLLADQGPALLGAVSDRRHHCLPRSLFLHAQS